jgi:hypothetical protein
LKTPCEKTNISKGCIKWKSLKAKIDKKINFLTLRKDKKRAGAHQRKRGILPQKKEAPSEKSGKRRFSSPRPRS